METEIFSIQNIIIVIIIIVIILLIREICTWYWKINEILVNQKNIEKLLENQNEILQDNNEILKDFVNDFKNN